MPESSKNAVWIVALLLCTGCPLVEQPADPEPHPGDNTGVDAGENDDAGPGFENPADIEFRTDEFVIELNSPTRPEAQVYNEDGELMEDQPINWASDDPSIIEISSGGMAIGVQLGQTELIATAGEVEQRWPARVVGNAVADVTVLPEDQTGVVGQQIPYMVSLRDANNAVIEDERPVTWSSDDEDVATVDNSGLVEAVGPGETDIVAVVEGVEGRGKLTVEDVDIGDIDIDVPSSTIIAGESLQLEIIAHTVDGQQLDGFTGQWSSSDDDIVTVDSQGLVDAVGVGEATVTATFDDLSDSVDLEVVFPINDVDAGDGFVCVVGGDQLYCAGANDDGQLGDGTTQSSQSAVASQFNGVVEVLSVGHRHGCLVDDADDVYCWGDNGAGQVGQPPGGYESQPVQVSIGADVVDVSAGYDHSCAVTDDDEVYCWGSNADHQLGSGDTTESGPVNVGGSVGFTRVVAGDGHSCAIGTDDSGYCWGANDRGQLGGEIDDATSATPQQVDGGYEFDDLSAGGEFTCGTAASGPPVCWGANDRGQLGNGNTVDQDVPLTIALDPGDSLLRIGAGDRHSCGVLSTGYARCWGAHDDDRLGIDTGDDVTSPATVDDSQPFDIVAPGVDHTCGLTPDDRILCWGASPGGGLNLQQLTFQW